MDIYWSTAEVRFFTSSASLRNALYRNNRDGTFTDVTEKAGRRRWIWDGSSRRRLRQRRFSGPLCLTVRKQHSLSQQWRRNLHDVTEKAGVAAPGWDSSAVWFDYDNDGRLDLFVGRFAISTKSAADEARNTRYCFPRIFHLRPAGCFTTMGTELLPMSAGNPALPKI